MTVSGVARCYLAFALVVRTVEDACPYNTVAWLKIGFGAIVARFFTALCFVLNDGVWLAG